MRTLVDAVYFFTALHMPIWWQWQGVYVMRARFYFEARDAGILTGWPWAWNVQP